MADPNSIWDLNGKEDVDEEVVPQDADKDMDNDQPLKEDDNEDDDEVQKDCDVWMDSPLFLLASTPTPAPFTITIPPTQPASSQMHLKGKGKVTDSMATPKPKTTRYVAPVIEIIGSSLDWSVTNTNFPFNSAFFELNNPRSWPDTTNHKNKVSPCHGPVSLLNRGDIKVSISLNRTSCEALTYVKSSIVFNRN